jgi:hypothetical protein
MPYFMCCTNHHLDRLFVVFTRWLSNLLQLSPLDHLINYLAMLIAKLMGGPPHDSALIIYTNLKIKIL